MDGARPWDFSPCEFGVCEGGLADLLPGHGHPVRHEQQGGSQVHLQGTGWSFSDVVRVFESNKCILEDAPEHSANETLSAYIDTVTATLSGADITGHH